MKRLFSLGMVLVTSAVIMVACTQKQDGGMTSEAPDVQQTSPSVNSVDSSAFIGEEKAKDAALQKAGISADGVVFDRVELEKDDGVWKYEVEFRQGIIEYDADVKADDGTILKWEVDSDN